MTAAEQLKFKFSANHTISVLIQSRQFSRKATDQTIYTNNFFQKELAELNTYFPKVLKDICERDFIQNYPGLSEKYKQLLNYAVNVQDTRRMSTCLLTLYSYKRLERPERLTEDNLKRAYALSWALRMVETAQVIVDDLIDKSDERYCKATWHKKVGVTTAVLDSYFVENGGYLVLQNGLKNHRLKHEIVHLFQKIMFKFIVGQTIDITTADVDKIEEIYETRLNKGEYTMAMPIRSAMYLANIDSDEYHERIGEILNSAGQFTCTQNDYWGTYASHSQFKKECNDIFEGKTNWLLLKALELANPDQKKIIVDNYGKPSDEHVNRIKDVYNELKIDEVYKEHEKTYFEDIHVKIDDLPEEFPKIFLHDSLHIVKSGYING